MTKLLVLEDKNVFERHAPDELSRQCEITLLSQFTPEEEILARAKDTEILLVNPTISVSGKLISELPHLRLVQTEGVGFEGVNLDAANKRGIYVCNCRGVNARAVAEHTVMLMLCCLRDVINGYQDVMEGRQNDKKVWYMKTGALRELGDCTVGFIGYGAIGKEAAYRLTNGGLPRESLQLPIQSACSRRRRKICSPSGRPEHTSIKRARGRQAPKSS